MSFNNIKLAVKEFNNSDNEIMFIHIREPEEIERTVKIFKAKTLLVRRIGLANITSNYSDANVEDYNYDYIIENSTIENLDNQASKLVDKLKKH